MSASKSAGALLAAMLLMVQWETLVALLLLVLAESEELAEMHRVDLQQAAQAATSHASGETNFLNSASSQARSWLVVALVVVVVVTAEIQAEAVVVAPPAVASFWWLLARLAVAQVRPLQASLQRAVLVVLLALESLVVVEVVAVVVVA